MKRIGSKILAGIAAGITLLWGVLSTSSTGAAQAEATGSLKIVVWYMVLQSLLFVLLSVNALLRIVVNKHTQNLQRFVYGVSVVVAGLYSILLAINIAPQFSILFTTEFWKQSGTVMAFFERLLFLIQGILLMVLSVDMLRSKLKHRGELIWIATACVALLLIPYGLQFFGVGLQLAMTIGAGAVVSVLTICQTCVVYAAFAPIE